MTHELRKYNQDLVKTVSNINIPIHKLEAKVKLGRKNLQESWNTEKQSNRNTLNKRDGQSIKNCSITNKKGNTEE